MDKRLKILHLPTSTGNNSWRLSRAERELGHDSSVLVRGGSWLNYPADIDLGIQSKTSIRTLFQLTKAFWEIRNRYDIFHFNAGSTLLHRAYDIKAWDLPYYPKKTKLFVTYNGCDARQKAPTVSRAPISACMDGCCEDPLCSIGKCDIPKQKCIEKFATHVKHIFALNPDLLWVLPQKKTSFLPYAVNGGDNARSPFAPGQRKKLKILHAPTNREKKGTKFILAAMKTLAQKYPDEVELILIEKMPHQEATRLYLEADLVIDQLLIGWYGAFAIEVMQLGKPVIAYINENDLVHVPKQMAQEVQEAFIPANIHTIQNVLERCVWDRDLLREKARYGEEYVQKWHDPLAIAKQVIEHYVA